jgi:hypothetical protein
MLFLTVQLLGSQGLSEVFLCKPQAPHIPSICLPQSWLTWLLLSADLLSLQRPRWKFDTSF